MTSRAFLVAKHGVMGSPVVLIREVAPGSSAVTLDRSAAWSFAHRLAQPVKNRNASVKHGLLNIHFTGLDGMTTDLGQATKSAR